MRDTASRRSARAALARGATLAFWVRSPKSVARSPARRRRTYPRGRAKIEKVLHEFKTGKLRSSSGRKVRSRKQAVAIALSEQRRAEGLPSTVYRQRRGRDAKKEPIPGFAGGTGAAPNKNAYQLMTDIGDYHVDPVAPRGRHAGYVVKFANTRGAFPGGLWSWISRSGSGHGSPQRPMNLRDALAAVRAHHRLNRVGSGRDPSGRSPKSVARSPIRRAWELWGLGYPEDREDPMFIAAFSDKGAAQERMRRLRRSHPGYRYSIRHTKRSKPSQLFGTRAHRRRNERMAGLRDSASGGASKKPWKRREVGPTGATMWHGINGTSWAIFWPGPGGRLRIGTPRGSLSLVTHHAADDEYRTRADAEAAIRRLYQVT